MSTRHWKRILTDGAPATPLLDLAAAEGWPTIVDEPRRHHHSRRLSWAASDDVQVHLLEFFPHALRTVVVTGEPHDGPVTAAVAARLDLRTLDGILADTASEDPRTALSGLYALTELGGIAAADPRTPDAYLHTLQHKEMVVRAAALRVAGGFRAWSGLKDALLARRPLETELAELVDDTLEFLDEEDAA